MTKTWLIADTHFGHAGVCKFVRADGVTPLRPWDDPDEMDEALVANWNAVVRDMDRVYVLGDVAMAKRHLETIGRCKGRKVLVKGNHDIFKAKDYLEYFDDIRACVVKKAGDQKVIMSHIPVHPESLGRFGINIHGHLHSNRVMLGEKTEDPRYINVSVEQINFTPVEFTQLLSGVKMESY